MHLKCIFHDYFFTLLEEGRTMFTCLLVLDKSSLYILIIIIVIRLPSPTLLCMYISRQRFCVFCTVRRQTLNVLLYCGSGPWKKVTLWWRKTRFTRQNVTLRCFATPAVHNKLVALVKTLSAEWRLLCVVPPALLWVNSSFLLKEVHEKCGFTAAPKSKSMITCPPFCHRAHLRHWRVRSEEPVSRAGQKPLKWQRLDAVHFSFRVMWPTAACCGFFLFELRFLFFLLLSSCPSHEHGDPL